MEATEDAPAGEEAEPQVVLMQLAAALDEDARLREGSVLGTPRVQARLARAVALPHDSLAAPLQVVRTALLLRAELQGLGLPSADWKPLAAGGVEPPGALVLATWDRRPVLLEVARSLERSRTKSEPWRTWLEWASSVLEPPLEGPPNAPAPR